MRASTAAASLGVALVLSGGLFDAEPLLAAGVAVTVLALAAGGWVALGARTATVSRALGARRVVEDEPLELRLEARASLPLPGGELREPLLGSPAYVPFARRGTTVRVRVRFGRRGRRVLAPAQLVVRDPLGIARRPVSGSGVDEILVLPRVEPVDAPAGGGRPGGRTVARPLASADGIDPDGLRPYRDGAPATRIHWPALARGAGLLERRLAPDADRVPLVVLDAGGAASEEHLDAAVRAAASLCLELARTGGCALMLPGERRPRRVAGDLTGWPSTWARLALVVSGSAVSLGQLTARAGPLLYVTARPPGAVPRAVSRAGALVVAPAALGGPRRGRPVLEVAGCVGYAASAGARGMAA